MSLLACTNLSVAIGATQVCKNLNLSFEPGQCWGILGRNGVGKTTLLHTLANLRTPQQGTVYLRGKPLADWPRRKLAQTLGVLFQSDPHPFPATVLETALIGRHPHTSPWQAETAEDLAHACAALQAVELETLTHRQVDTLSGGERQRLALAGILAQAPQVLLLDEPANHLDLHFQVSLLEMFTRDVRQKNALLLMALHDINQAARFCDHLILMLGNGKIVHGPTHEMLREDHLQQLYQHPVVKIEAENGRAFLPE